MALSQETSIYKKVASLLRNIMLYLQETVTQGGTKISSFYTGETQNAEYIRTCMHTLLKNRETHKTHDTVTSTRLLSHSNKRTVWRRAPLGTAIAICTHTSAYRKTNLTDAKEYASFYSLQMTTSTIT